MSRAFKGVWIPADLWLRKDLTVGEKMLYIEIESLDNDFGCIASNKKLGEVIQLIPTSVSRALKVLETKGLIKITYDNYVTFTGRKIIITPCENDKGVCENDKHSNTISDIVPKGTNVELSPKDKCSLFIDTFNKIRNSKYQPNEKLCSSLNSRIKKYKSSQIFTALKNAMKTEYHINNNFKYLTPEFILREEKIELYLNASDIETQPKQQQKSYNSYQGQEVGN